MLPSTRFPQSLAIAVLTCFALICLVSLGESFKVLSSATLSAHGRHVDPIIKRTWESEQGPFSPPRSQDVSENEHDLVDSNLSGNVTMDENDDHGKVGIPVLGDATLSAVNSIVASIVGGVSSAVPVPGNPTQPIIPASTDGGLFGSVISILAGAPSAVPVPGGPIPIPTASSGDIDSPLGGVLSALSAVGVPTITAPPAVPTTGSGGILGGLDVLGGVASALDGVLGSPDGTNSNSGGLLGQISADVVGPIASIAADPASILADPAAAISNLQVQVSSVLDSLPSAVAAGVQLANNVGGQIADALNATTDVLDSIPDVAGGVADQLGSLLNAAPDLATGIAAAALSAVNQVESILTAVPGIDGDVTGILDGLQGQLSLAVTSALPEVSSLAGVVGSQVVGILPSTLQPLVAEALSTLQSDATSLGCQVSDVVSGTAIIFNVPCDQTSSAVSSSGEGPTVTAPVTVTGVNTAIAGSILKPCCGDYHLLRSDDHRTDDLNRGPNQYCDRMPFGTIIFFVIGAMAQVIPSSTSTSAFMVPTPQAATNGFQYVGCYADNTSRALRDAELLSVGGGMTNTQCIVFCQGQGSILAGTEDGSECYCGSTLIGSIILPVEQCNITCAGDATGSTMCGGSWALSVWSPDGTVQQIQKPGKQFMLPSTPGYYHPGGANLESSILAAVASEASGLASVQPASASAIIQSVSFIFNMGMSSIASSLALAAPTSTVADPTTEPSALPLGPGPVVANITIAPTATTLVADTIPAGMPTITMTMTGRDVVNPSAEADTSDGNDGTRTAWVATHGAKGGRWAPRRRFHWA
ncbi:hypothetical protein VSDG_05159 [Cytospora chrysosperma]|uniref:WSC domain-containing protein n=1 Tax=Cytospora chrysosperma TaxID=252740 RepID=A0A423VXM6_CYTCH|nr:hypothetical protein VSDG_05159 [Valsa sordida]